VSLDRLWAGWRADYVGSVGVHPSSAASTAEGAGECLFCTLADAPADEALRVASDDRTFAVLNLYPYTSAHLIVVPRRHERELEALDRDDAAALMEMTRRATRAIKAAYSPDGINVGMNLGRAAGAGIPDHLHVHVVGRWVGDTNFMTSVAEARVLPEALGSTLDRIRSAWPA
jgi:ATP adenylyltransferase